MPKVIIVRVCVCVCLQWVVGCVAFEIKGRVIEKLMLSHTHTR